MVMEGHEKSWNLGRPFSRSENSRKVTKGMESHGKFMENDAILRKSTTEKSTEMKLN